METRKQTQAQTFEGSIPERGLQVSPLNLNELYFISPTGCKCLNNFRSFNIDPITDRSGLELVARWCFVEDNKVEVARRSDSEFVVRTSLND